MDVGFKMVESPVHLADFGKNRLLLVYVCVVCAHTGAALTSADPHQLQEVLECLEVTT